MNAQNAYNTLRPEAWTKISLQERLRLLKLLQENMEQYADELALEDQKTRNNLVGEEAYLKGVSMGGTVGLMGGTVMATIDLYNSIASGKMMKAKNVTKVSSNTYDLEVYPQTSKDKVIAGAQHGHLRVKGEPKQTSPFEKPAGVIAILGAGNYSSALEMIKALFWENKVIIHKPHHLNAASNKVWERVFAPLVEIGAVAFCDAEQGRELSALPGLTAIYFTGGADTAGAIMATTKTPLISECGGNNPSIIVPGDRPWTDKEIEHQALQFVSCAKMGGGAVCGRAQTLVTSKHWPQREEFLNAVRKAFTEDTPAASMYYPGTDKVKEQFHKEYPNAEVLSPEGGRHPASEGLFIVGASEDSFAARNESFCLVNAEIPLDVPADAESFLPAAVKFCNEKLLGSLAAMIVIDEDTRKAHEKVLSEAVDNLEYGAIAVNTIPPLVFMNAYLTWGGHAKKENREFASGRGNFGNVLCYDNVEKSIIYDNFIAPTHLILTTRYASDKMMEANARYTVHPTWARLISLVVTAMRSTFAKKDF